MLKSSVKIVFFALIAICLPKQVWADIPLAWDANSESDLSEYRIYYSRNSSVSTSSSFVSIPKSSASYLFETNRLLGDTQGDPLFFSITALDTSGNESRASTAIQVVDQVDLRASDRDKDGLNYQTELVLGTDPNSADSDSDDVLDGQEVRDGSDPLDSGSSLPVLNTEICNEWNGFLGMWNVLEHVNLGLNPIRVAVTLKDISGNDRSDFRFTLDPGTQFDLLVHDMEGKQNDTYGNVCLSHNGQRGELDGRMTYYKPEVNPDSTQDFQFAFSMPMNNGQRGPQFVGFNTYQPSLDPQDSTNVVANWIQLVNSSNTTQSGTLYFYDLDGNILSESNLSLLANSRQDFSGHQFGPSLVGLIEWRPANSEGRFQLRNVRYVYDNPNIINSFDTAFQLEATKGTGSELTLPLDTRGASSIIELSNTGSSTSVVLLDIYSLDGEIIENLSVGLGAHSTRHLITDSILQNSTGIAHIRSSINSRIIATVMQYKRTSTGGISYMYGLNARPSLGQNLRGSYNTFLTQDSELWISNSTNTAQTARLSLVRFDQTQILDNSLVSIPARGLRIINLSDLETENNYGVARLTLDETNSLSAQVLRRKGLEFVIPTPMRQ